MNIQIKDCLTLPSLVDGEVISGENYLDKEIDTVSVLEVCSKEYIEDCVPINGQLMLSSFITIKDNSAKELEVIQALSKGGCPGLVICCDKKEETILKDKVRHRANSLGFPIILVEQEGFSFGTCIKELMERILWGGEDSLDQELINNSIYHMMNFERYTSFENAIRQAALANDFQIVVFSENYSPLFSIETRHRITLEDGIKAGRQRNIDRGKSLFTKIEVKGVYTYWGTITIKDEKYLMLIVDNENTYTAATMTRLANIIETSMKVWKFSLEKDGRSEFLKALKRGNPGSAIELKDASGIFEEEIKEIFLGIERKKGAATKWAKKLEAISLVEDGEVYGIITDVNPKEQSQSQNQIPKNHKAGQTQDGLDLNLFTVSNIEGVEDACQGFRLIEETLEDAPRIFRNTQVFTEYEMVLISNAKAVKRSGENLEKNYTRLLSPLNDLSQSKRDQLIESLQIYILDGNMSIPLSAKILGIHPNTLQYRLKKIQEILEIDVTGGNVSAAITTALILRRLG